MMASWPASALHGVLADHHPDAPACCYPPGGHPVSVGQKQQRDERGNAHPEGASSHASEQSRRSLNLSGGDPRPLIVAGDGHTAHRPGLTTGNALAARYADDRESPAPTIIANGPRTIAAEKPPVSGSAGVAEAVADTVGLASDEAEGVAADQEDEALAEAVGFAEAEALPVAPAEAEALEVGLATASSTPRSSAPRPSKPRSPIPLSSKPRSSIPWACIPLSSAPRSSTPRSSTPRACIPLSSAPISSSPRAMAAGAKRDMANAPARTSNTNLRIISPRFRFNVHE